MSLLNYGTITVVEAHNETAKYTVNLCLQDGDERS